VCLVDWIGADYCSYTTDALYDLLVRFIYYLLIVLFRYMSMLILVWVRVVWVRMVL